MKSPVDKKVRISSRKFQSGLKRLLSVSKEELDARLRLEREQKSRRTR